MKALTIWQPWASLIMAGAKQYEFRRWPAPQALWGERIVIHAGKRAIKPQEVIDLRERLRHEPQTTGLDVEKAMRLIERLLQEPGMLPLAAGLGTAILGKPQRATEIYSGTVDSDRIDHQIWGWPLEAIMPFEPIVPARGAQGFWMWGGA